MADQQQLAKLREGVKAWNQWRAENPSEEVDLSRANLSRLDLREADLEMATLNNVDLCFADLGGAHLHGADLEEADICWANCSGADLSGADLPAADFTEATLTGVNFGGADLTYANFYKADLNRAYLQGADLSHASLIEANITGANLSGAVIVGTDLTGSQLDDCRIYGASVWDVKLSETTSQRDLIITPDHQDKITVDDVEVAQFIYLLLENKRVRKIIDTITSKVVLILGRFSVDRKAVLDSLRDELRKRDFTPILFDFDKPASRDLTETISTLAHMARFVIADITDAKSIPQELQKIAPGLPSLPIKPIILDGQYEYAMFKDFGGYLSFLPPYRYQDIGDLLASLEKEVIGPALKKALEIDDRRKEFEQLLAKEY